MVMFLARFRYRATCSSRSFSSVSKPLSSLLGALGHTPHHEPAGLHPLVQPLAKTGDGDVLGLLRWPLTDGEVHVVRTTPQASDENSVDDFTVRSFGTIGQFSRRAAVEEDCPATGADKEILAAAADATLAAGGTPYSAGELAASRLRAPQFLLMRVGPFADVWEEVARGQLAKGDETAALIAAERSSALNPGWGCCMYLQAQLMGGLGRTEEQRDLSLGALESPFWTLGAPLTEVLAAAQVTHLGDDFRAIIRAMEDKVREQQGAPPRSSTELAMLRAMDTLDEVVRLNGRWDDVRQEVASALREAGCDEAAEVVVEGGSYS